MDKEVIHMTTKCKCECGKEQICRFAGMRSYSTKRFSMITGGGIWKQDKKHNPKDC